MAKRLIKLLGEPVQNEDDKAAEAITPGHLVTFDSNGDLIKHATSGGVCATAIAMEREEAGQDIDTAYAIGDKVKVGVFGPGTRFNALVASGVNVAKGALLMSAGNGTLAARTSTNHVVGRAMEAINATVTSRLRVEAM
jgi:hypothetical protein